MTLKQFKIIFPPLISLFIFVLGSGLFTTLLILRLKLEQFNSISIGAMTTAFYIGLISGAFRIEKTISSVGHIRAFAGFASLLAVISILQGIYLSISFWIILRLISGYATAGIYIVIESWLLSLSKVRIRGKILSLYMVAFYAAQSLGQLLLNFSSPGSLLLFTLTSMFCSLAIIPLTMTRVVQPKISEPSALSFKKLYKASGSGIIGSLCSGLILGAVYGLLPLYFSVKTNAIHQVTWLMALTIIGGMLLQYPIGRLSDVIPRRKILAAISLMMAVLSIAVILLFEHSWVAPIALFFFGGAAFTIYPVSVSTAVDHLKTKDIISGTQGLLLANSIGSAIGPLVAPLFIASLGSNGLFIYFICIASGLFVYLIWRSVRITPAQQEEQFITIPQTTPIVAELDPRAEKN